MMFDYIDRSKRTNVLQGNPDNYMDYKNQTFKDEIKLYYPKVSDNSQSLLIAAIALVRRSSPVPLISTKLKP